MTARHSAADAGPTSFPLAHKWVAERFPAYGRASVAVGVFLAPLAFYRGAYGSFGVPKITVLWFAGLGAVAFWAASSIERRVVLPRFRLGVAGVAFLAASSVATVFSLSPRLSLVGTFQRYGGLIPKALLVAIMLAVVGLHWEQPERLRRIAVAIAAGSTVLAGSVLLQQAGIDRVLWPGPVPGTLYDYPFGTVGHSNFAGAHLGLALPCLWYLYVTSVTPGWRLARSAVAAAFALDLSALWYTQSRGGMLAAAVGLAVVVIVSRDRLGRWTRAALACLALVVVVGGVLIVWHPGADAPPPRLANSETLRTKTLQFRLSYWDAAMRIFADHPVVGTGPETFYAYYPQYRSTAEDAAADTIRTDNPHNIILDHAASSGVLGVVSYLVVIGMAITYGARRCRQLDGPERLLLACFVGVFAGYLAQGLFSIDLPELAVMGWVSVGAIAAHADPRIIARRAAMAAQPSEVASPTPVRPSAITRRFGHVFVAAAVVSLAVVGLRPLQAAVAFAGGRIQDAHRLDPVNGEYLLQAGLASELAARASQDEAHKQRLFEEAGHAYLKALRLQPNDAALMVRMANVETERAADLDPRRFAQADAWWQRAIAADPKSTTLRANYEQDLPAAARRAVARLEAQTQVQPNDAPRRVSLAHAYLAAGEPAKARRSIEEALRLAPGNPEAERLRATIGGES